MFEKVWIDHVVLRVLSLDRVSKFYQDVFGATVERELDIGLHQLRIGEVLIDLIPVNSQLGRKGGPAPGNGKNLDHFCMRVEPFDRTSIENHLTKLGVQYDELRELYGADGYGPSIYIHDPEGNVVEIKGSPVRGLES